MTRHLKIQCHCWITLHLHLHEIRFCVFLSFSVIIVILALCWCPVNLLLFCEVVLGDSSALWAPPAVREAAAREELVIRGPADTMSFCLLLYLVSLLVNCTDCDLKPHERFKKK